MQVNIRETKARLLELGELAWKGERVVIDKAGKPFLELIPYRGKLKPRVPGRLKGRIQTDPDFDQTSEKVLRGFEGS